MCDIQQQDDQPIPVDTKVEWKILEKLSRLTNFVLTC